MKQVQLFMLSILFIPISAAGQTAQKDTKTEIGNSWKLINENGYSIQYPHNWDLDKSGQMGMNFILLSKQTSPQDRFRENVNLLIQKLAGQNIDLNKYVEVTEGQIKTMVTHSNVLESKRLNANAKTFHKIVYTGEQGEFNFKFEQYYWIQDEKAYVLTLTCEAEQFDTYRETGEKILNSFMLK